MKKLSDYKDEEAIELWADLLEPMTNIIGDPAIVKVFKDKPSMINIARSILKMHSKDATEIMLRIDPTPVDGVNVLTRVLSIITDIRQNEDALVFFGLQGSAKKDNESSGFATESTEEGEK